MSDGTLTAVLQNFVKGKQLMEWDNRIIRSVKLKPIFDDVVADRGVNAVHLTAINFRSEDIVSMLGLLHDKTEIASSNSRLPLKAILFDDEQPIIKDVQLESEQPLPELGPNSGLNTSRQQAILTIWQNVVSIIFRPPGTSKSRTQAYALLHLIRSNTEVKVLGCASTNTAVNELLAKCVMTFDKHSCHISSTRVYTDSQTESHYLNRAEELNDSNHIESKRIALAENKP